MDYKEKTLEELDNAISGAASRKALVGLDGFVDRIMKLVDSRHGQGDRFEPIPTIEAFGRRVSAAAGKSCNIEMFPAMEKIGGNGPIMANALLPSGVGVNYIGAIGENSPHPVFADFAKATNAVCLAAPGVTHALEFDDGKIMLGTMASLDNVTYEQTLSTMGEGAFIDAVSRADLIALVNWTMLPNMTAFLSSVLDKILPNLGPLENGRTFFFDLADPEKRSDGDLKSALKTIGRFRSHGRAILGLNLKEAQRVWKSLGNAEIEPDEKGLRRMAEKIREQVDLQCVAIHPVDGAACATKDGSAYVKGPYCERPKITTGAGDHFNAGFALAQTLGMSSEASLTVAVSFSGFYVREARSPSLNDIDTFIRNWS